MLRPPPPLLWRSLRSMTSPSPIWFPRSLLILVSYRRLNHMNRVPDNVWSVCDLANANYSSSLSPFGSSSSLAGKRDSFGKLPTPTSSSKDQLHTLLEEEEEEEGADVEDVLDIPCEAETDVLTSGHASSYKEKPREESDTPRSHASSIRSSSSAKEPRLFCSSLFRWIDNLFSKRVMYADHTSSPSKSPSSKRTGNGIMSRKLKSARGYSESRKQPRPHSMVPTPCDWTINQDWYTFRPE